MYELDTTYKPHFFEKKWLYISQTLIDRAENYAFFHVSMAKSKIWIEINHARVLQLLRNGDRIYSNLPYINLYRRINILCCICILQCSLGIVSSLRCCYIFNIHNMHIWILDSFRFTSLLLFNACTRAGFRTSN